MSPVEDQTAFNRRIQQQMWGLLLALAFSVALPIWVDRAEPEPVGPSSCTPTPPPTPSPDPPRTEDWALATAPTAPTQRHPE